MQFSFESNVHCLIVLSISRAAFGDLQKLLFIFRHGDRTTDRPLFPTDPNNGSFYTNGLGNLTEEGRVQGYNLGKRLRDMYPEFITNDTEKVKVRSSARSRCMITTGCVLIGMYKPEDNKTCLLESEEWQEWPVAINSTPINRDYLLCYNALCPVREKEKEEMKTSAETQEYLRLHNETISALANFTGYGNITEFSLCFDIYYNLLIEKIHNLTWDSWVEPMWSSIENLKNEEMSLYFQTNTLIRIYSGPLLNEIIDRIQTKDEDSKLFLYGTHDSLIQALLLALNVFNGITVPYTATLIVELHDNATVRLMYLNSTNPPTTLTMPECRMEYCPVDTMVNIAMPFRVSDPIKECYASASSIAAGILVLITAQAILFNHFFN